MFGSIIYLSIYLFRLLFITDFISALVFKIIKYYFMYFMVYFRFIVETLQILKINSNTISLWNNSYLIRLNQKNNSKVLRNKNQALRLCLDSFASYIEILKLQTQDFGCVSTPLFWRLLMLPSFSSDSLSLPDYVGTPFNLWIPNLRCPPRISSILVQFVGLLPDHLIDRH